MSLPFREDRPLIMGIINLSPRSFFRPHTDLESALKTAENMIEAGADILDIGSEATNPFVDLKPPAPQQEIDSLMPLILAIKQQFPVQISVDTSRPEVMREAIKIGVDLINDQRALQEPGALAVMAASTIPVCLMHFFADRKPGASDLSSLLDQVKNDLQASVARCEEAGISRDRLIIDPGFGQGHYGKNTEENFYLLKHLSVFVEMGYPVLSGWSRKSMIGDVLGLSAEERLFGSIAADTLAAYHGAAIIRTHDVRASREAVTIAVKNRRVG